MADLHVRELHPGFGAEVEGLDPQIPLDDETCRQLRNLFDERGVLLFRKLDIDLPFQKYLAHMLIGQDAPQPEAGGEGQEKDQRRDFMFVSNREPGGGAPYGRLLFHCDMMWSETPHQALSLYGVDVEEPTVPTLFASMAHGWDTLPADLRARVEGLHAVHGHDTTYPNRGADENVLESVFDQPKTTTTEARPSSPTHRPDAVVRVPAGDPEDRGALTGGERGAAGGAVRAPLRPRERVPARLAQGRPGDLGQRSRCSMRGRTSASTGPLVRSARCSPRFPSRSTRRCSRSSASSRSADADGIPQPRGAIDRLIIVPSDSRAGVAEKLWPECLPEQYHGLLPRLR